jgi:hypothetical protein
VAGGIWSKRTAGFGRRSKERRGTSTFESLSGRGAIELRIWGRAIGVERKVDHPCKLAECEVTVLVEHARRAGEGGAVWGERIGYGSSSESGDSVDGSDGFGWKDEGGFGADGSLEEASARSGDIKDGSLADEGRLEAC